MRKILLEAMRQGRVFSSSAAKKMKVNTRVKHHMSRRNARCTAVGERNAMFCCCFQWEGSSNRQPKLPHGSNKNTKKTQKYPCVTCEHMPRCRIPVFHNNYVLLSLSTRTKFKSSAKSYWRQHSEIPKDDIYICEHKSRLRTKVTIIPCFVIQIMTHCKL